MSRRRLALLLLTLVVALPASAEAKPDAPFVEWNEVAFQRARQERRVLLLMVSTSWCHWCHVMKRETYADPAVRVLLRRSFLPIYVDADARPDLAERFRNYRWPATAFLTPTAQPILAIRGYRSPTAFRDLLQDVLRRVKAGGPYPGFKDPNAHDSLPGAADRTALERLRVRLTGQLDKAWDPIHRGWGRPQKYPVPEPIEHGLRAARSRVWPHLPAHRARQALQAQAPLLDRAWGGVYQYSVGPSWDRWHPEKIMTVNAGALTNYVLAGRMDEARLVYRWFRDFLTDPDGGFYTSQDADAPDMPGERFYRLSAYLRMRHGVPRVDKSMYARENGLAIQAHCLYARATGKVEPRRQAVAAAERILRTHRESDGSFRHAAARSDRRYVVDQSEMGRALLALYDLTLEARWLESAQRVAGAMQRAFARPEGGYFDATPTSDPGVFGNRQLSLEGNASAARFLLELGALTSNEALRREGRRAIAAVADEKRTERHWRYVGGLLLAVQVALAPAVRVDVRGPDDAVGPLLAYARKLAEDPFVHLHRTVTKGPPVAILCSDGTCAEPASDSEALRARMVALHGELSAPYLKPTIR